MHFYIREIFIIFEFAVFPEEGDGSLVETFLENIVSLTEA